MLQETKYTDLNNLKKHKSIKDVQKSAHSQGYDVSEPKQSVGDHYTVDMTHRKTGEKVSPRSGGKLGASYKGKNLDTTLVNQISSTIKADAAARGRVDKTPKAKAKRKEEAAKNKADKKRDRDPFTRRKTYEEFMCQLENWID